jgi:signal transduction histidine kinase/CheY-like chemotaxis protein
MQRRPGNFDSLSRADPLGAAAPLDGETVQAARQQSSQRSAGYPVPLLKPSGGHGNGHGEAVARRPAGLLDLRHGRHVCLIHERASEAQAAVIAFFTGGLAAGERCLYQGPTVSWRRIERSLEGARLAAGAGRRGAALARLDTARLGSDPRAWLELVREAERQAIADGFDGVRVSWEMPAGSSAGRSREPEDAEELLGRIVAEGRIALLCRYPRQRSSSRQLERVLRSHPAVMLGGEVGLNLFYEPPGAAAVPGAPAAGDSVDRMLAQLRRELRRERRLHGLERQLLARGAELDRADQDRAQLLDMLAHELRNPLSTMSVALRVLRLHGPCGDADETWKRALDAAERQVFHQAALVDELLEAFRVTRGEIALRRVPLDLRRLVSEAADAYRQELRDGGLTLDVEVPEEAVVVAGDRPRLWQTLAHLLQNALKFSSPGGRVGLRLRRAAGGRAEISVSDRGVGISPELLPHVFDVFTQEDHSLDRANGGLGIGLAVVKGVIELHGGQVEARSEGKSGQGTEVKLLLPLLGEAAARHREAEVRPPAPVAPAPAAAPVAVRRVLVVEDNVDTATTLRDFLELSGFEVELAGSGTEGVETARRFLPDVVLCDLGLPGLNGYEVAAELRRDPATATTRLIALTGYGRDEDRRRSRDAGFDLHLIKPVEPTLLRRLLGSVQSEP